ncbi:peptidylprolyl isomerase SurA [Shewanella frigidimarina]|jgi:peptidyl-prolyl cis-trans isomerase SurA|uniref:Chaperone SurA n=1 Tax=Shewanella frigidimarina (strain NCIMB 400) TaxID=318167 RepID=SURA_SHEFN|nr:MULTISPECIES: peptidylprolyl isomerase SurA [Shewanella]Q07YK0.1 RecName: Full=Chaperone SurA; AltName: Full=Peptidyl-prolyl cis-trans isomerase SurA; Short=PPIase SurA; AltName: Full=Rotamase SurA; Flags: Precursor [Shewanella frigidimarina NCIMB 400]ABI72914.1 PpiC-type peptidyl-prolyl cis-trans isomerase [Shewanella frigidimarina NCIMB 400]PKI07038.1 chaperone SurA [Shewanella sp. 11B5]RPA38552.1 peptidylprolyl isomerase SurA [Shewanella frigidimarina]RPA64050.1 peptidylprolyl isomerase |tara:strand:- start:5710 stop:7014 length:1305 start_codon:yes stop_codon:yes gene_type:complete
MKHSKKIIFALLALAMSNTSMAAPMPLDRVSVQINDGIILESEITNMVSTVKANAKAANQTLPSDDALRTQVIERLILTHLQMQMAERIGLQIGDLQLDQTIENIAKEQKVTVAQMQQTIESEGTSFSQYREQLRQEVTLGEIQRIQVQRRIQVSPQEISGLVKLIQEQGLKDVEFQIGHILIEVPSNPTSEQLEGASRRAEIVLKRLNNGDDFRSTAIASSSGPKALEGGIWDFMNINEMPTLFAEVISNAKKGDIIGPIKSGSGFHIIKVVDTRGLQTQEVEEVKSRHILLKPSPILSEDRAKAMLANFLAQVRAGDADFAKLATQYSEDPGSAAKGGELGWADPSMYVPEFTQTLASLQEGQYSEPFRTTHGWHVVQLESRRKTDATEQFNSNRAHQLIFRRKFNEELQNWLDEMRSEAYIEIVEPESKRG